MRRMPWAMDRSARPVRAGLFLGLAAAAGCHAQTLDGRIQTILSNAKLGDARIGISIVDLESGAQLASRGLDDAFIPASNMKLLTSATALSVLGGDFVFRTELLLDGRRLVVRGSGDPALADPAILEDMTPPMTVSTLVSALAEAVAAAGVTRVDEIVIDDRVFDRQLVHPTWPADQLHEWYCAQVGGVNVHTNVLSFFPSPSPSGPGRAPVFTLEPEAPWIPVDVRARTVEKRTNSVWLSRAQNDNSFTLFGEVGTPIRAPIDVAIHEPQLFFGRLLAQQLLQTRVGVGAMPATPSGERTSRPDLETAFASVRLVRDMEEFGPLRAVASVTTHIADVLERCNSDSQNLYAECLLKRAGHQVAGESGSWANGAAVVRMKIAEKIGPRFAAATVIADGSGMSRDNQVSPRTMTQWLGAIREDRNIGPAFIASLATPTKGNLVRRFRDVKLKNQLHAKSGSINNVRTLSGYLIDPQSGRAVAFSVLINDLKTDPTLALKLHEEVVKTADAWLASRRPARNRSEVGG